MPEYCTCGALLPEDARFCHKCGKPQREEPVIVELEPPPLPVLPVVELPPIGFNNPVAVWIALRVAVTAFLLSMFTNFLTILWLLACGFFCVYLYRRRTGENLSRKSGAHLGWLAGVFVFVLFTILFTLVVVQLADPEAAAQLVEQARKSFPEADAKVAIEALRSPGGIVAMLLFGFTVTTLLPALGGWLGAGFLRSSRSAPDQRNA